MANDKTEPAIACEIRCMSPATVEAACRQLDPAGIEWVAYTCKLSGEQESILLLGDELAAQMLKSLPAAEDITGTKILAGLYSAELCECDVATLAAAPEHEVVTRLQRFATLGMLAHRRIQGMNYYRLVSGSARRTIKDAVDALC